jgi:hypothetical protein
MKLDIKKLVNGRRRWGKKEKSNSEDIHVICKSGDLLEVEDIIGRESKGEKFRGTTDCDRYCR